MGRFQKIINKYFTPSRHFPDDTFIVSYPKSGNTWVRFLVSNVISGSDEKVNFHTAVQYIPDFDVHKTESNKLARPRILKSHQAYNPRFASTIYIIRDVRDVYVSYFFYLKKKLSAQDQDIGAFIRNIRQYNIPWEEHVASWIDHGGDDLLIIRYEDLISQPVDELKKILGHCRIEAPEAVIERSVEWSSFNSMSKIEKDSGRPFQSERDARQSSTFVRSGKVGDWKNHLDDDILQSIHEHCGPLMQKFGYN